METEQIIKKNLSKEKNVEIYFEDKNLLVGIFHSSKFDNNKEYKVTYDGDYFEYKNYFGQTESAYDLSFDMDFDNRDYMKMLKSMITIYNYYKGKQEAVKSLGSKCYICGKTENLKLCKKKIYSTQDQQLKTASVITKINKSANYNKATLDTVKNEYILLCEDCYMNRKKLIARIIATYDKKVTELVDVKEFKVPDSLRTLANKYKISIEKANEFFPKNVVLK